MSGRIVPILRHAGTGVPLPFWDVRVVPRRTVMEYLGVDPSRFASLFHAGVLTPQGGWIEIGAKRPQVSYIPAVIWAHNRWTPPENVLRTLALSAPDLAEQITATRHVLDEIAGLLPGVRK